MSALAESKADARAITALRDRTLARLTELHDERAGVTARLDALTAPDPGTPGDPALLDELPRLAGILDKAPRARPRWDRTRAPSRVRGDPAA